MLVHFRCLEWVLAAVLGLREVRLGVRESRAEMFV